MKGREGKGPRGHGRKGKGRRGGEGSILHSSEKKESQQLFVVDIKFVREYVVSCVRIGIIDLYLL